MAARKAKKRKNKKRTGGKRGGARPVLSAEMTAEQLRAHARRAQAAGRYAEAVDAYRFLRRRDPGPQADELFRQAALDHVARLMGWGRQEDALRLAEEVAAASPGALPLPVRVLLAIEAGRIATAVECFAAGAATLADAERGRIEEWLAVAILLLPDGEREAILAGLPPELASLRGHIDRGRAALDAMDDPGTAAAILKQIPFRSPLRNLRLVLSGLLADLEHPGDGAAALGRVPADSPFHLLASLCAEGNPFAMGEDLDGPALATLLDRLRREDATLTQAVSLFGLDEQVAACLQAIAAANGSPKRLAQVILRYRDLLPSDLAAHLFGRLLLHYEFEEDAVSDLAAFYGTGREAEQEFRRLAALMTEAVPPAIAGHETMAWDAYLESRGDVDDLERAMVLRHQADVCEANGGLGYHRKVMICLERSLDLDPADRETWLRLCRFVHDEIRDRRHWYTLVNRAAAALPEDVEILQMQMEAAARRGAFKKAAGIATGILRLDPVNLAAKEVRVRSALAHGTKQVLAGRVSQARKTFAFDPPEGIAPRYRGLPWIAYGLATLIEGEIDEGWAAVEAGIDRIGNRLGGLFCALAHAERFSLDESLLAELRAGWEDALPASPAPSLVAELVGWVAGESEGEELGKTLRAAGRLLLPLIEAILGHEWPLAEGLAFCRDLWRAGVWSAALLELAANLDKLYPEEPRFMFFQLWAVVEVERRALSDAEAWLAAEVGEHLDEQDAEIEAAVDELLQKRQYAFLPDGKRRPRHRAVRLPRWLHKVVMESFEDDAE